MTDSAGVTWPPVFEVDFGDGSPIVETDKDTISHVYKYLPGTGLLGNMYRSTIRVKRNQTLSCFYSAYTFWIKPGCTGDQQTIMLQRNWNTISSYLVPYNTTFDDIFAPVVDNIVIVKNRAGQIYWPKFGVNSIQRWDYTQGYRVYTAAPAKLVIPGAIQPSSKNSAVVAGWNMVAMLSPVPVRPESVFPTDATRIVKNNDGRVYWPEMSINTIGALLPGQGYRCFMSAPAVITYP
jgi:hypothetical protein